MPRRDLSSDKTAAVNGARDSAEPDLQTRPCAAPLGDQMDGREDSTEGPEHSSEHAFSHTRRGIGAQSRRWEYQEDS
jgi:hypothetical protein